MGNRKKPLNQKEPKPYNTFLKYTSLGLQLVLTLALAGGLGFWIDNLLGFKFPAFLLTFIMLALIGALYQLIKSLQD